MEAFTEKERLIYGPYANGVANVYGDPLRLYRRLIHGLGGEPNQVLADIRGKDQHMRFEATEKMVAATQFAFELIPFDVATGQGTTEDQTLALVKHFLAWIREKKKTVVTPPTLPQPTVPTSCQTS